jgi:hypothetical protein
VSISGGHPHLLQLLGSHLIEHEDSDPDGIIDSRDLHESFQRICYEDRASVYASMLHELELYDQQEALFTLLGLTAESPYKICAPGFPTCIDRRLAQRYGLHSYLGLFHTTCCDQFDVMLVPVILNDFGTLTFYV